MPPPFQRDLNILLQTAALQGIVQKIIEYGAKPVGINTDSQTG